MHNSWVADAVFYHIYPPGLCGAPERNDGYSEPVPRLAKLLDWLDHIQSLGCNAILLGPVFESVAHGYDTTDYCTVDRRLGTHETLVTFSRAVKQRGMRLIFDGVFNHVGRSFSAFQDVRQHGYASSYRDWFANLNFEQHSPLGDPFNYEGWAGHYDLVKLNLSNEAVRAHLLDAVRFWIEHFDIDGLRLDAADVIAPAFFQVLREYCRNLKSDFWLMGEMVHGDYNRLANPYLLDSTTNYEVFKGLYSSHVDRNYFEIAYSLNRQFGEAGLYRDLLLYNFADNHDVNRVASNLTSPQHLYPLYGLLFTIPGIPSIYYGSEWGIEGKRTPQSDQALRPTLDLSTPQAAPHPELAGAIQRLSQVRQKLPALRMGNYQQLHVNHQQLVFQRQWNGQTVIVGVNSANEPVCISLHHLAGKRLRDVLNHDQISPLHNGAAEVELYPNWLRILVVE